MKVKAMLVAVSMLVVSFASFASAQAGVSEGVNVGGHVKFYMYDNTTGEVNGQKQQNTNSAGMSSHALQLYVAKQLNSWLRLDGQMELNVSASATPSLGNNITRATSVARGTGITPNIYQLFVTGQLPYGMEMRAGSFNPMFSEYYAREMWWQERYHMDAQLGSLIGQHDMGIELYKNFDFSTFSLPVYVELANGQNYIENNDSKTTWLHVAPEFLQSTLKVMGSYAFGKEGTADNNTVKYAAGLAYKIGSLDTYGEYLNTKNENNAAVTGFAVGEEKANNGYHVNAMYTINDEWRAGTSYSNVDLANTSALRDVYKTNSILVNYFFSDNSSLIGQYSIVDAKRSDDSQTLKYNRFTLGFRATF